jgi:hypothetical protein
MQPPFAALTAGGGAWAVGGISFLGHLDIWPIRGPALADDPVGKQAYAGPIDAQVSRFMRRDAPVRRPAALSCNHHVSVR